jgi:MarR family transcriptional regulator, organic hydroperoxide resistance regulator
VRDFPSKNISDLKTILAEIYESLKSLEPEIEEANKASKAARTRA